MVVDSWYAFTVVIVVVYSGSLVMLVLYAYAIGSLVVAGRLLMLRLIVVVL